MNENRKNFLIEQGKILTRLERGEALTLEELQGVLRPGCESVFELLQLIRESAGITDTEIKESLGYPKDSQIPHRTLSALAKGDAIIREKLSGKQSDSGHPEKINFPI